MLTITIPASESFDETNGVFINTKAYTLQLEHSLVSISKWESKWKKAFLGSKSRTEEESLDYIRCMTINNVPDHIYEHLTYDNIQKIHDYVNDTMTASYIPERRNSPRHSQTITSELIYFWMCSYRIPSEYQKWHLNRLLTLIKISDFYNNPPKKMSRADLLRRNHSINQARRKSFE